MRVRSFQPWVETRIFEETFPGENLFHYIEINLLILQLTEAGQTGTPGVPALLLEPPVVREFRAVAENVRSQNPGMEEPTVLVRCSDLDPVTLDLVMVRQSMLRVRLKLFYISHRYLVIDILY